MSPEALRKHGAGIMAWNPEVVLSICVGAENPIKFGLGAALTSNRVASFREFGYRRQRVML
jgi:hypothetical protein